MTNKKYKLTKNTKDWYGTTLFQIESGNYLTDEPSLKGKKVSVELDGVKYKAIIQ